METILIFGSGDNQRTLIQSARKLGYRTVVIDPDPNAAAKDEADIFRTVGPNDKTGTIRIAEEYQVKGIITCQMENPLYLMSELAEEMGFIFPTKESVIRARNKWLMKEAFLSGDVACAKGILLKNENEIAKKIKHAGLQFPLIIKPHDSYSSRGVYKVNSIPEIIHFIKESQKYSSKGQIIIEEFLDGFEVSVESITHNNITEVIQITDKVITPYPCTVELAHVQPSSLNYETQERVKSLVKRAINSIGLNNCASHAEVKITRDGVKMIEIGARLGGDFITSHLVPLSIGVNIEAASIQIAMGEAPDIEKKYDRAAVIRYLTLPEGKKIRKITDFSTILQSPSVKYYKLFVREGDVIPPVTNSARRSGFIIVEYENRQQAIEIAEKYISCLQESILF